MLWVFVTGPLFLFAKIFPFFRDHPVERHTFYPTQPRFFFLFFSDVFTTEMRDGPGPDVASGPLFLHPMRLPVWRGRIPGEGR